MICNKPFVKGIAAVDSASNICFKSKDGWNTIGKLFDHELSKLDFRVLSETVNQFIERDAVFVMGYNVANDMKQMFEDRTNRLVISTKDIRKSDLSAMAYRQAFNGKMGEPRPILVLGGVTVYEAFVESYDSFLLTRFSGSFGNEGKCEWTKNISDLEKFLRENARGSNKIYKGHNGEIVEYLMR